MKKYNLSIGMFSFLFSFTIVFIFSVITHFYVQETINTKQANEEHLIGCYANKVTDKIQSVEEFKKLIFGSLESFTYQVAIFDKNDDIIYSTFKIKPKYNPSSITYVKNNNVYYNHSKTFKDEGVVKVIFKKELDYHLVYKKSAIIIVSSLFFLILCSLFLYFHIKNIYGNINKKLDIFFKDAIHEIRTPLGVIQINLDFLDNTLENSMPLKRAQGGLRNLTSVYESLEYSIKNKKVNYKKENINLSNFLANRIDFFDVLAEVKEITIQSEIEEDTFILMSRVELQRLIDNNISNAIKYSKEKTEIKILLYKKENDFYLKFSNHGETIKNTEKVFKRFYRGDEIRGGFGLGLSIVAYICYIYDIEYMVKSKDGNTVFLYKLPHSILNKEIK